MQTNEKKLKSLNEIYIENLGKEISNYRKSEGMTQQQMAELLNVNRTALSLIENGEQQVNLETLKRVIDLTGKGFLELIHVESQKIAVFDTSAILKRPQLLNVATKYASKVIIPIVVINELNNQKDNGNPINKMNASQCMNWIDEIKNKADNVEILYEISGDSNDDKIFNAAYKLASNKVEDRVYLITNDKDFKFKNMNNQKNLFVISSNEFSDYFIEDSQFNLPKSKRFYDAIIRKNIDAAKDLYDKNSNIDVNCNETEDGLTPLIYSIINDNEDEVKYLLSLPSIDINRVDSKKFCLPPLSHAIQKHKNRMVKLLIENGADVNKPSENAKNPGNTPLMIAAWHCNVEIVKLLIENGACVNQQDRLNGMTPLTKAVFDNNGHKDLNKAYDIVKYLLEHGADRNIRMFVEDNLKDGMTILEYAYKNNYNGKYDKIISLLEEK